MSYTCTGECGTPYTSSGKAPQRGYEYPKGHWIVISPEELAAVKGKAEKVDTMKVVKSTDTSGVDRTYVYDGAYRVLPPEKATATTLGSYRAVYEVVQEAKRAVMVRFAPRDRVSHYALVADPDGTLWACELSTRRNLPYDVPQTPADPKVKAQARMLVESIYTDDPTFEPEPDPLFDLVMAKVDSLQKMPGIGQTAITGEAAPAA